LESEGKPIGIVTGMQGTRKLRVKVIGEAGHAGSTKASRLRPSAASSAHPPPRTGERGPWIPCRPWHRRPCPLRGSWSMDRLRHQPGDTATGPPSVG
jgi:hypothetical protein